MASGSKSKQRSQQQQTSQQFVDPSQVPFLGALRRAGTQVAGQQLATIGPFAEQLAGGLGRQGQQLLGQLGGIARGGAGGQFNEAISGLLEFSGGGALAGADLIQGAAGGSLQGGDLISNAARSAAGLLGPNPAIGGQINALQSAIQQNLQATAGTIAGQATLGGATGGSRQALATGLAAQQAQTEFRAGAQDLLAQDFAARQQLAPQLVGQQLAAGGLLQQGGLQQAGQQIQAGLGLQAGGLAQSQQTLTALAQAGQLGVGQAGIRAGAAGTGLEQLGGLLNLGLSPFAAQFAPLQALAGIIGPPTVLGQSQGTGTSRGSSVSLGFLNNPTGVIA